MSYTKKTNTETNNTNNTENKVSETKTQQKIFLPEDTIPCRSIVSGGLYIEGSRSHILYSWADCGDVVDVEYLSLIHI